MRIKTSLVTAGALAALLLLAGCTDAQDEERADVATLRSGGPATAATTSAATRERPVVRPDEGGDVFDRYVEVFNKCLNDEGVAGPKQDRPDLKKYEKNKEAARKCDHLYPETWMERERRTNPEFADLLRETARCLVDKGHKVTVGGDPIAIRYEDNAEANKAYEDEQECQRKAFRESVENYRKGGS